MGKKKMDVMEAEKPRFIEGAIKNGHNKEDVEKLWEKLVQFANYGFNKAHSASYATIAYRTAYLKANYPLEYMASLLEGDLEKFDRVILDLKECERMGIEVLAPNINYSDFYFSTEGQKTIRFGLGGIKNVGHELVKSIVKERQKNGSYEHLDDFVHRNYKDVNKKAMEYLIMAGTMDSFGDRGALLSVFDEIYERERIDRKSEEVGQIDIFSTNNNGDKIEKKITQTLLPKDIKTEMAQVLQWEKELLGLYFSSHPLDNLNEYFNSMKVLSLDDVLETKRNNTKVILGVIITKERKITTKKGDVMAFLTLEDKTAKTDAILFPKTYIKFKNSLPKNVPVLVSGRVNVRDGEKSIVIGEIKGVDTEKHSSQFDGIVFQITPSHTEDEISNLKAFIEQSEGEISVKIVVQEGDSTRDVVLNKTIAMDSETRKWIKTFST